jgi:hypothetical protein
MQDLVISHTTIPGYRPVVQSLPRETPPAMGDYIALVQVHADTVALMRARDSIDPSATNSGFARIGPPLSSNTFVVQAAGGHDRPVFFTSSRPRLGIWRGETDATGRVRQWDRIVPSADGIATDARRFFVNPWDPDVVYVLDLTGIRMSDTGGTGWRTDNDLTAAIGDGGAWDFGLGLNSCSRTNCLLNDMAFDPTDPDRRFAAGLAGVFMTLDGQRWHRLLDTRALPSRPLGLWFDPITDPDDATLYVATFGRGILRIHPIPR